MKITFQCQTLKYVKSYLLYDFVFGTERFPNTRFAPQNVHGRFIYCQYSKLSFQVHKMNFPLQLCQLLAQKHSGFQISDLVRTERDVSHRLASLCEFGRRINLGLAREDATREYR